MAGPRIICLGMNEESQMAIEALVGIGADICAIAGRPAGNAGRVSDFVDLSNVARDHGIGWLPVNDVNAPEMVSAFAATDAEMLFVLGWSELLCERVINAFGGGVVGSHPSLLPYGRGRAPVPWTILEDLRESAVSLFRMSTGVDDGAILKQTRFDIPERATARVVYDLVSRNLAQSFAELYRELAAGMCTEVPQERALVSWRSKRIPQDGWIDFRWSANSIDRLVRAVSEPYPGAYSYIGGERAVFWAAQPADGEDLRRRGVPGQVLARREGMILVQAGDEPLWLAEPEVPADRPVAVRLGDRFGFRIEDELYALRHRLDALERTITKGTGL